MKKFLIVTSCMSLLSSAMPLWAMNSENRSPQEGRSGRIVPAPNPAHLEDWGEGVRPIAAPNARRGFARDAHGEYEEFGEVECPSCIRNHPLRWIGAFFVVAGLGLGSYLAWEISSNV